MNLFISVRGWFYGIPGRAIAKSSGSTAQDEYSAGT
jgi:hypothetical protein